MTAEPDADPVSGTGAAPDPFEREDLEDAYLEGDRTFEPGTARAAFSHRTFRTVYLGAFASNIGTWMQNVVLGALAWQMTKSGFYLGLIAAAQPGPHATATSASEIWSRSARNARRAVIGVPLVSTRSRIATR